MSEDTLGIYPGQRTHLFDLVYYGIVLHRVVIQKAYSAHAGIDLDMGIYRHSVKGCVFGQRPGIRKRIDRLRNIVINQLANLVGRSVAEDKHRTVYPGFSHLERFGKIRNGKPVRTRFLHLLRRVLVPVSVAIRLHDGAELR